VTSPAGLPHRQGRDEIALLTDQIQSHARQLQETYERLAAALEAQRRFVADASTSCGRR